MTTATATRQPATDPAGWIRRIDRIEWPAAGCWAVRPGGSVTVERATRPAGRRWTATMGGGALHVAELGRGSTLELHLATHGGALRLSADVVDADRLGNW